MNFEYFLLIFGVFIFLFFPFGFSRVVWIPTKKEDYERIGELANLKEGMKFYDLGSGTADLLFYLAKKYNVECVGIEISPLLYFYSKIRTLFQKNVKIKYGNFFREDLSKADVIYFFLLPQLYPKLEEKILKEAKNDTLVISAIWPLKNLKPIKISQKPNSVNFYLYKIVK